MISKIVFISLSYGRTTFNSYRITFSSRCRPCYRFLRQETETDGRCLVIISIRLVPQSFFGLHRRLRHRNRHYYTQGIFRNGRLFLPSISLLIVGHLYLISVSYFNQLGVEVFNICLSYRQDRKSLWTQLPLWCISYPCGKSSRSRLYLRHHPKK